MKRSEVVAAILVTIDSCKMMVNPEELTNEGMAEEIMRTIEEVGMEPPRKFVNNLWGKMGEPTEINEWEPENE